MGQEVKGWHRIASNDIDKLRNAQILCMDRGYKFYTVNDNPAYPPAIFIKTTKHELYGILELIGINWKSK